MLNGLALSSGVGAGQPNLRDDVRLVQRILVAHGRRLPALREVWIDGIFGHGTASQLRTLQGAKGLPPNGHVRGGTDDIARLCQGLLVSTATQLLSVTAIVQQHERFESNIEYMYCDTLGKVTVGIGTLIEQGHDRAKNLAFAHALGFRHWPSEKAATLDDVATDYDACKALAAGHPSTTDGRTCDLPATRYDAVTSLFLPEDRIRAAIGAHVAHDVGALRAKFHGFDRFPLPAREALADMQYNMGGKFSRAKWPTFFQAVEVRDWYWAAEESERPQLSSDRNKYVHDLLERAADEMPVA
jgi:GH24 family phage-related lysozyme (muramidase)